MPVPLKRSFIPRWPAAVWLIAINCVIFFVDVMGNGFLRTVGSLNLRDLSQGRVWELITFQFLHASPGHLIFNMIWLYFLGMIVEGVLGKQRFVLFYLLCGIGGGALFLLFQATRIAGVGPDHVLVGASAGILGIMAAAVRTNPRMTVQFLLLPVQIPLWVVLAALVALAVLTIRIGGWNAGGEAAHIGGAIVGFVLFSPLLALTRFTTRKRSRFWRPGDPADKFFRRD